MSVVQAHHPLICWNVNDEHVAESHMVYLKHEGQVAKGRLDCIPVAHFEEKQVAHSPARL